MTTARHDTAPGPASAPDRRTVSVRPVAVPPAGSDPTGVRAASGLPLQVRVTAPVEGRDLPVIVFSHGNAWSMDGYGPLVDRWAAAGFVVVQPTHLDSRRHGIGIDDPRFPSIWRARIGDLHAVLDHLDDVLAGADGLAARTDTGRAAVVGHSWGGQSAGAVLGARVRDVDGVAGEDLGHPRAAAGALLAATGSGESLTPFAAEHLPFMRPDFSTMTRPTLVVAGGRDQSRMSTRGPDWFTDAYHLGPPPQRLLTIADGEHTLGGLAGEAVGETSDEDPARVELVADAVAAHLLDVLRGQPDGWRTLQARATASGGAFAVEAK